MPGTYGMINALDVIKFDNYDVIGGVLDEASIAVPEFSGINPYFGNRIQIPFKTIDGTSYHSLIRTQNPKGVAFRKFNEGVPTRKALRELRRFETYPFQSFWQCDAQLGQLTKSGISELMADDAAATIQGMIESFGEYFYYGQDAPEGQPEKAFPGLIDHIDEEHTIDAKGTGDNLTSIYFTWLHSDGASWITGNNGTWNVSGIEERTKETEGGQYRILEQNLKGFLGLQVKHKDSVWRIKNIDVSSALGEEPNPEIVTDSLLMQVRTRIPVHMTSNIVMWMHPYALRLWRASRPIPMASGIQLPVSEYAKFEGYTTVATETIKVNEKA